MALEKELKTYQEQPPKLLQNEGRYILIHEDTVAGVYDTYPDALKAGYEKYGLKSFLVKEIEAIEQIQYFTRDLAPCPT